MRIHGGLGAAATTGGRVAVTDLRFSGAPTGFGGFASEAAEAPPLTGIAEFGVEIEPRDGLTLGAGYRGVHSERQTDNQIGARMRISW